MDVIEYLNQVKKHKFLMEQDRERADEIEKSIASTRRSVMRDVNVQSSTHYDIAEKIAELEQIRIAYIRKAIRHEKIVKKIIGQIQNVKNADHETVLYCKYIKGYTWQQISEQVGFTERHCQRLHKPALLSFLKDNGLT